MIKITVSDGHTKTSTLPLGAFIAPSWEQLKPHQQDAVNWIADRWNAGEMPLVRFPTGGGKTYVLAGAAQAAAQAGTLTFLFAHRRKLVQQLVKLTESLGLAPQTLGSAWPEEGLVITTVQRFDRLRVRLGAPATPVRAALFDEAHHAGAASWSRALETLQPQVLAGVSATPGVKGGPFTAYLDGLSFDEGIQAQLLVRGRYFVPSRVALDRLKVRAGEFVPEQAEQLMRTSELYGDLIRQARLIGDQSAVVYGVTVRHAEELCRSLREAGFTAQVVHGHMTEAQQEELFAAAASGAAQFTCCASLIDEGVDIPRLSVMMNFAPTFSPRRWAQRIGRIMRAYPGKTHFTVYDFTGSFDRIGPAEHLTHWGLEPQPGVRPVIVNHQQRECECGHAWQASTVAPCPNCGAVASSGLWRETQVAAQRAVALQEAVVSSGNGLLRQAGTFLMDIDACLVTWGSEVRQLMTSAAVEPLASALQAFSRVTGVDEAALGLVAFGSRDGLPAVGEDPLPVTDMVRSLVPLAALAAEAYVWVRDHWSRRDGESDLLGTLQAMAAVRMIRRAYVMILETLEPGGGWSMSDLLELPGLLGDPHALAELRRSVQPNERALVDAAALPLALPLWSEAEFMALVAEGLSRSDLVPHGRFAPHLDEELWSLTKAEAHEPLRHPLLKFALREPQTKQRINRSEQLFVERFAVGQLQVVRAIDLERSAKLVDSLMQVRRLGVMTARFNNFSLNCPQVPFQLLALRGAGGPSAGLRVPVQMLPLSGRRSLESFLLRTSDETVRVAAKQALLELKAPVREQRRRTPEPKVTLVPGTRRKAALN